MTKPVSEVASGCIEYMYTDGRGTEIDISETKRNFTNALTIERDRAERAEKEVERLQKLDNISDCLKAHKEIQALKLSLRKCVNTLITVDDNVKEYLKEIPFTSLSERTDALLNLRGIKNYIDDTIQDETLRKVMGEGR